MSVSLSTYIAALPQLQAKYAALKIGNYILKIEPISGTDVYYSDGTAQYYTGKISLYEPTKEYSDIQLFFTDDGLVNKPRSTADEVFQTWILETVKQARR